MVSAMCLCVDKRIVSNCEDLYGPKYRMFCMAQSTECFVWPKVQNVLYCLKYRMFCMAQSTECFVWPEVQNVLYGLKYRMFCMAQSTECFV